MEGLGLKSKAQRDDSLQTGGECLARSPVFSVLIMARHSNRSGARRVVFLQECRSSSPSIVGILLWIGGERWGFQVDSMLRLGIHNKLERNGLRLLFQRPHRFEQTTVRVSIQCSGENQRRGLHCRRKLLQLR